MPLLREGRKVPVGLRPSTGAEAKREEDTTGSHPCHKTLFSAEGGAPQLKSTACLQVSIGWSSGVREKEARTREVKGNKQTNFLVMHNLTKKPNFLSQPSYLKNLKRCTVIVSNTREGQGTRDLT